MNDHHSNGNPEAASKARSDPGQEADLLQQDIKRIRGNLGHLVHELDVRRRHALDVRRQVRRHPLVALAISAAVIGLVGGAIALGVARRRRRRAPAAQLHRLRLAVTRMIDAPERVARVDKVEPNLGRKVLGAGGSAAASAVGSIVAKRLALRLLAAPPPRGVP